MKNKLLEKILKEYDWVCDKWYKLNAFITFDETFLFLDKLHKELLKTQLRVLETYRNILEIRIDLIEGE